MKISVSLLLLRGIMGTFEGCRGTPREARQKKSSLTSTPSGIRPLVYCLMVLYVIAIILAIVRNSNDG